MLSDISKLKIYYSVILLHWSLTFAWCTLWCILTRELIILKKEDEKGFNELKEKRFGARFTGYVFSTIHSDLVTKLYNEETKDTSGPFRCGFSTNINSVSTWVNTIHIHTMLKLLKDSNYISKPLQSIRSSKKW